MVAGRNGSVDNPAGLGGAGGTDLPFGMQATGHRVQAPDGVHVVGWGAARDAVRLHRRCDLRRPARAVPPARAQHQPVAAGRAQAGTPERQIAALRPYKGYGAIRLSENAGRSIYNSLQLSADKRYTNGFKVGVAYTLGKYPKTTRSDKRNVLWNTYDDTNFWGPSSFDRRHVLNVYYIYDLPFWRDAGHR